MADYASPIDVNDFIYRKMVYYTNQSQSFRTNVIIKLTLTEANFNFDLCKEDGSDFRLMDSRNSAGVLNMWIAYWNKTNKKAVVFFKLPSIGSYSTVSLDALWGSATTSGISDPNSIDLLFFENFLYSTLSSSKWSGDLQSSRTSYGYSLESTTSPPTTITNPLTGVNSWIIEAGVYADFDTGEVNAYSSRTIGVGFNGLENSFDVGILQEDKIKHNVTEPGGGTISYIETAHGGIEGYSYNEIYIHYNESTDAVTLGLKNRNTYDDVEYLINRRVEGDTTMSNIILYGRETGYYNTGGYPTYISWLSVREYDGASMDEIDASLLYVPYETVLHQDQDLKEYTSNLLSPQNQHETSFGGNPYLLSDNSYDSDFGVWESSALATSESYVHVTFHSAWGQDVTDSNYTHYDSGHSYYYNASKLSDSDNNITGRTYWQCTTNSGWAAIKFPTKRRIGSFRVMNTTVSGAAPKDFEFYGSNYNPVNSMHLAKKLSSGSFVNTSVWKSVVVDNFADYVYYILLVKNTHGGLPIEIQEWEMMDYISSRKKYSLSQIRLHPSLIDNSENKFPKEISVEGSNDGVNWYNIMPWRKTYTPFVSHILEYGYWQYYSFYNITGYWSFRLLCRGNWGSTDGKIAISEVSLHALVEEDYIYRILFGSTNNIKQIWATNVCSLDGNDGYIFVSNDELNKVINDTASSGILPSSYVDFNVV